jgi:hypothetical protein
VTHSSEIEARVKALDGLVKPASHYLPVLVYGGFHSAREKVVDRLLLLLLTLGWPTRPCAPGLRLVLLKVQVTVAGYDQGAGGRFTPSGPKHDLSCCPELAHQGGEIAIRRGDHKCVYGRLVSQFNRIDYQTDVAGVLACRCGGRPVYGFYAQLQELITGGLVSLVGPVRIGSLHGDPAYVRHLVKQPLYGAKTNVLKID